MICFIHWTALVMHNIHVQKILYLSLVHSKLGYGSQWHILETTAGYWYFPILLLARIFRLRLYKCILSNDINVSIRTAIQNTRNANCDNGNLNVSRCRMVMWERLAFGTGFFLIYFPMYITIINTLWQNKYLG